MAKRLATNLKDEYLSCSICLDQYRQPKTLPCDHIFCQECITSHVTRNIQTHKTHVEVSCPLCREKISIKSKGKFDVKAWVNSLPTDSLIGSLMQTLNMHEISSKSPQIFPKLCESHGGKPCDAFCFTHAHLMCWECAARDHRLCSVDSADKAKHVTKPEIESLRKTVENNLARARELSRSDDTFKKSKVKVFNDIEDIENRLEKVYVSAKHQLFLLKSEVQQVTKMHLDERKNFYDAVQSLLELKCSLEIMSNEQEATKLFALLEQMKKDVERSCSNFKKVEEENESCGEHYVKFIRDERLHDLLMVYSSVGFIDSNVPGSSSSSLDAMVTPRTAPESLTHIFKRPKPVGSSKTT